MKKLLQEHAKNIKYTIFFGVGLQSLKHWIMTRSKMKAVSQSVA